MSVALFHKTVQYDFAQQINHDCPFCCYLHRQMSRAVPKCPC